MCIPDLRRATHALWKPREPALRMRTFKHLRQKISNKGPKEFTYLTKTQEQIWDLDPLKIQRPHTPNPGHLILRIKTLEQKLKTLAVLFLNKGPQITQSESLERSSYRKYRDLTQWMETPPPNMWNFNIWKRTSTDFRNLSPWAKTSDSDTDAQIFWMQTQGDLHFKPYRAKSEHFRAPIPCTQIVKCARTHFKPLNHGP